MSGNPVLEYEGPSRASAATRCWRRLLASLAAALFLTPAFVGAVAALLQWWIPGRPRLLCSLLVATSAVAISGTARGCFLAARSFRKPTGPTETEQ